MARAPLLVAALCLAAVDARADPEVNDIILDPWAPLAVPAPAAWSVPQIPLIVDPWQERGTLAEPRFRRKPGAPDLGLVEIVDPWAGRRAGAAIAAFPAEEVVDPWPLRSPETSGGRANQNPTDQYP